MNIIRNELNSMGIVCDDVTMLQNKNGITVARIASSGKSYVLKCFRKEDFKREIMNYQVLSSLGIPTIKATAFTDSAILLEDIGQSTVYRLGMPADLSDPEVARRIAVWYKQLHNLGYDYVQQHGMDMYDEADYFTLENIACIKDKTRTQNVPAWSLLEQHFDMIRAMLNKVRRTLTYNDFYYTNMVVARDESSALMFDYNLLGKGYAYSDLRNVMSSLSDEAGKTFLEEYGNFDSTEKALDDVVSVVVTLYLACQREQFPNWAHSLLDEMETKFNEKIKVLLECQTRQFSY